MVEARGCRLTALLCTPRFHQPAQHRVLVHLLGARYLARTPLCRSAGLSTKQAANVNGLCRFCPLLPTLSALSRGDRDRVGDLGD
jgi:hypothetical protein